MDHTVVYELTESQLEDLRNCYRSYSWWDDRTLADVRSAIEHTDVTVRLCREETETLIAAGQVLTDFVYYGKIYDVIVDESLRGDGVGHTLLEAIVD